MAKTTQHPDLENRSMTEQKNSATYKRGRLHRGTSTRWLALTPESIHREKRPVKQWRQLTRSDQLKEK